ncbi:hypothetical protein B0A52_08745 [Exophiala mesophila]|uniref:F-box domain-containing protein n=1 Tax=Exophiala mesophila TaxID=212818 RepID=A0A438MWV5_EXOME|nr:hypothetical protein B0A52_08745 [Exophiala mesophila]
MATPLSPQPYTLLDLPDELKLQIVNNLDKKRDLYNLSRTCRVLEDMTMRRLYLNVDLGIPIAGARHSRTPILRPPVTQSMRHLAIRSSAGSSSRQSPWEPESARDLLMNIFESISPNQLSTFKFLHPTPLIGDALDVLTTQHNSSLQQLSFYEIDTSVADNLVPTNLSVLDSRTVNDGEIVSKIITSNRDTLQQLRLGQEKYLLRGYGIHRTAFLQHLPQPSQNFFKSSYGLENMPRLRDLSLHGLNLVALRPSSIPQALAFCRLERLCLESCPGSAELLESIAATFHWSSTSAHAPIPRQLPQLKQFILRSEEPNNALKDSLIRFLCSFSGLETLSLLFENATILERPSTFLCDHGSTMRSLVLESRIQPREHLSHDTSRPFGVGGYSQDLWEESINDIARLCPNLVELGMGFPWNDEIVRIRRTLLPTLKHLRTIHIRNFPENNVFSQLGDYTIKEYATKFIEWVYPALVGGARPALEHFAMGPTLYETRMNMPPGMYSAAGHNRSRSSAPEFLRTHHFAMDWAKTRFGRWSPMITPVTERWVEESEDMRPLAGVFEQVWLR